MQPLSSNFAAQKALNHPHLSAAEPQGTNQACSDAITTVKDQDDHQTRVDEDRENRNSLSSQGPVRRVDSPQTYQQKDSRGELFGGAHNPMTPTGLAPTSPASIRLNWRQLAIQGRLAAYREAQRNMSSPSASPTKQTSVEDAAAPPISHPTSEPVPHPQRPAASQTPTELALSMVKKEPSPEASLSTSTADPVANAADTASTLPVADVSVDAPAKPNLESLSQDATVALSTSTSIAAVQTGLIAALTAPNTARDTLNPEDALRTEVMGPPPSLPSDPGYPPLNPVVTDGSAHAPAPKRKGAHVSANDTHRRPTQTQVPADFEAPTNLNGKMPYALFQTIKKVSSEPAKGATKPQQAERSISYTDVSTSGDAAMELKQAEIPTGGPVSADSIAVDPVLADVLTDVDSVATATETRETSPDGNIVPESSEGAAATNQTVAAPPSHTPSTIPDTPKPSKPVLQDIVVPTPATTVSEVAEASPTVPGRRTPSNRGASMQASQSISSSYADPLGLKKHRELQLQESTRARRSPSVGSPVPSAAARSTPTPASGKKTATARTIVPPSLVEPPPGMMLTPEGRFRTIPGIAGAIVPSGLGSASAANNLAPRLEDKGSANNDFCESCGGNGRFVCCDGCPRSFHFHCMNPPLDIDEMPPSNAAEVLGPQRAMSAQKGKGKAGVRGSSAELNMDEMWFCNVCVAERKPKAVQRPKGLGPFGLLLPVLSQQNPKSFQLPAETRTYFKDVVTANDGEYVDGAMVRSVKPNKHGEIEARDPYRLKDKNGDAVLCYRCGGTALPSEAKSTSGTGSTLKSSIGEASAALPADHTIRDGTGWRKIVSCNFCTLHWHIDCVDPPMLGMPKNFRKWMCPAHSDHVNDRRRVARVGAAVPKTIDLPVPTAKTIGPGKHFRTRVLNNGDIDIIPDPTDELMGANGITGSHQSGVKEIPLLPGVIDSPATTIDGSKLTSKIRFRVPEKVIRTDFWSKLRADESAKIGTVFYVAAGEVAGRTPTRLVAAEDGEDVTTRYRPFGKRDYPRSGLDSLADIASARLAGDKLASTEDASLIRPSRTRQLVETALGIELTNDDVPESNVRSSLDLPDNSNSSLSPLSSLSDSSDAEAAPASAAAPAAAVIDGVPALSEEELIKRIASQAASGVTAGEPIRLSKRKAAVAAESAIHGSPDTPNKKARSSSDTPSTPTVAARSTATATATTKPKVVLTLKRKPEEPSEAQAAMRTAYHLAEQYSEERKEIEQLRAIRELMKLKGKARMLEFLLSPNEPESEP